jgi:hypothetical protein
MAFGLRMMKHVDRSVQPSHASNSEYLKPTCLMCEIKFIPRSAESALRNNAVIDKVHIRAEEKGPRRHGTGGVLFVRQDWSWPAMGTEL